MKKIFAAACAAVMVCGLCLPAFAGCKEPTLYATFEAPELPEGVVDLQFHTHSSMEEDGTVYYDLLTFNYDTQNDVYIEIFVEPQYTVKEVTLRIEAEDGSWTEEVTGLEEEYLIYEEHPNTQLGGVDCMAYRTKLMKSFAGKTGKAKASVPVLVLGEAQYGLHTEKIWDDGGNTVSDADKARVETVLEHLPITAAYNGTSKTYASWAEFEAEEIGKTRSFPFGGTYKLKIQYPEGTDLTMNTGGSDVAVLSEKAGEDSAAFEQWIEDGWIVRHTYYQQSEGSGYVGLGKYTSVVFNFSETDRTAEWTFTVVRETRIRFNEYELYHTILFDYLDLI